MPATRPLIGSLHRLLATSILSVLFGLSTFGDPLRFASRPYEGLKDVAPIRVWGAVLIVSGLVMGLCLYRAFHPWALTTAASLSTGIYLAACGAFTITAAHDHRVSWWGAFIFGYLAYLHVSVAVSTALGLLEQRQA